MVRRFSNKKAQRNSLKQDVEAFLRKGGKVTEVPRGCSSHDASKGPPPKPNGLFQDKTEERTPLTHLLSDIDSRRKQPRKPAPAQQSSQPRRITIYDDFGEPLRYEWVDPNKDKK